MAWNIQTDRPIYLQLMEQMKLRIISGVYQTGDKLPSVRDLASEASVNPNTMQKALSELERCGLIYTNRTTGRYITEETEMISQMKYDIASHYLEDFLGNMKQLGFSSEEVITLLQEQTCSGNTN